MTPDTLLLFQLINLLLIGLIISFFVWSAVQMVRALRMTARQLKRIADVLERRESLGR